MPMIDTSVLLPRGIRVRGNSLVVQTRKQVRDGEGNVKVIPHFKSVRIKLPKGYGSAEYNTAFLEALEEAKKEKILAVKHIAVHGLNSPIVPRKGAVPTFWEVFQEVNKKRWAGGKQERNVVIYVRDIFSFFGKTVRIDEMQTYEMYENFIEYMQKTILNRKANQLSTFSTRTTNKRLGIIRVCIAYAIQHGLLDYKKVLNPDPTAKNYGWANIKTVEVRKKKTLTKADEMNVIVEARKLGLDLFADAYVWLIDTGMRYETEFMKFTIKNIDYKAGTISFLREKTGNWTNNLPLSKRALEIAKRYRSVAMLRTDQRMFADLSKAKLRSLFDRFGELCEIKDHSPYITRRTFCTRLGEKSVHPAIIMDMAGHKCIETSGKYYIESTDVAKKNAMKAVHEDDFGFEDETSMMGHNSKRK